MIKVHDFVKKKGAKSECGVVVVVVVVVQRFCPLFKVYIKLK